MGVVKILRLFPSVEPDGLLVRTPLEELSAAILQLGIVF